MDSEDQLVRVAFEFTAPADVDIEALKVAIAEESKLLTLGLCARLRERGFKAIPEVDPEYFDDQER